MHPSRLPTFFAALAAVALAHAEAPRPQVYALLSAVGNRFEVVQEKETVGSHLPPYERRAYEMQGNVLNRLVLQGLDRAVADIAPQSRRVYLSMNPRNAGLPRRDEGSLPPGVLAELRKMDRGGWDRLLVALPAYRNLSSEGLAARTRGLGIFASQCQSDTGFRGRMGSCENGFRPPSGPEALTPEGKTIAANSFVAPYTFIEVWVLDPRTLAVLDRTTQYGHRKLADTAASAQGIIAGWHEGFLASQIVAVVQTAARAAVEDAGLRGTVQVNEKGAVPAKAE